MSLIQWLAVGKSFCSIKDAPSRYRMTQQHLLPKFGPLNRPGTDALSSDGRLAVAPSGAGEQQDKSFPAAGTEEKTQMTTIETEAKTSPAAVATPKLAYPLGRWTMKNPFSRKPGKAGGLVQAELSLDAVRPVRNDLSDADLEAVPAAKPARVAKPMETPAPPPAPTSEPALARPLIRRLRARLFGRA
jgi:hypothetical protein